MEVDIDTRYITLLNELCFEYNLPPSEYSVAQEGAGVRVRASVGSNAREAVAASEPTAREEAAELLYKYLRRILRVTDDFVEADALKHARDRPMEMGQNVPNKRTNPEREMLNIKIADYHRGLILQFEEFKRVSAMEALLSTNEPELQLNRAAAALGLEPQWGESPTKWGIPLVTVELPNTVPCLLHIGDTRKSAAEAIVDYLQMTLLENNPTGTPEG